MGMDFNIDIEKFGEFKTYLIEHGVLKEGADVNFSVLTGGVSNKTILMNGEGKGIVFKQALEKLRVQVDWFSDPSRILREAEAIRKLGSLCEKGSVPELLFLNEEDFILGMEAIPSPHENFKDVLLSGNINLDYVSQFGELLGTIHSKSFLNNSEPEGVLASKDFFISLRIEPYYEYTKEQVPQAANFLTSLIDDCLGATLCLVHGDYSPKNILIQNEKIILLDHEVAHYGDPAFDIGFALTHLLSKASHLVTYREQCLSAAKLFVEQYFNKLGELRFW